MKKLIRTINAILLSTLLLNAASIYSMEIEYKEHANQSIPSLIKFFKWLFTFPMLNATSMHSMEIDYKEQALQAEKYNQSNPHFIKFFEGLLTLPNDCLQQAFYSNLEINSNEDGPYFHLWRDPDIEYWARAPELAKKIKNFMRLRTVCKQITNMLTAEKIGNLFKDYDQKTKNWVLPTLTRRYDWTHIRLPILILICAGANNNNRLWIQDDYYHGYRFLHYAVLENDTQFIEASFKHGANSNIQTADKPLFYSAKTKEIAELFIKYGANIHVTYVDKYYKHYGKQNILWETLKDMYPSELIELYLQHKADTTLCCCYGNSLLHEISDTIIHPQQNFNNILKKAQLLVKAIPAMINVLNKMGQTPLDITQKKLNMTFTKYFINQHITYTDSKVTKAAERLIALFKEHGALTAQELRKKIIS